MNGFRNELYDLLHRNRHLLEQSDRGSYVNIVSKMQDVVGFPENDVKDGQHAVWFKGDKCPMRIPSHIRFIDSIVLNYDHDPNYRLPVGLLSKNGTKTAYGRAYFKIYYAMMAMHKICTVRGYGKNIATIIMRAMCETGPAYANEWAKLPKKIKK
jgi:hypothetical protein